MPRGQHEIIFFLQTRAPRSPLSILKSSNLNCWNLAYPHRIPPYTLQALGLPILNINDILSGLFLSTNVYEDKLYLACLSFGKTMCRLCDGSST
jgi:hypothetical protein